MIAKRVRVHGIVQGVGFRWSLAAQARREDVAGWVRNRADGTVEAQLEGAAEQVDAVITWARQGPRFAQVSHVEVAEVSATGAIGFEVEP